MNRLRHADPRAKAVFLWLLVAALAGMASELPRIPQPPQYHDFADRRACLGMANCLDTASNALFLLAGMAGLHFLHGGATRNTFTDKREALPYRLFFLAAILLGLCSGYYHLAPDNSRLVLDRTAISLALMSWLAAIVCERIGADAGMRLLPLLLAAALGSVGYWSWSEAHGSGDLRPYGLMQLYTMVLIPLLLWLYPPRYSGDSDILTVILLYLLALTCDLNDRPIAALTGVVSGHTAKHAIAALALYWVVVRLKRRRIL